MASRTAGIVRRCRLGRSVLKPVTDATPLHPPLPILGFLFCVPTIPAAVESNSAWERRHREPLRHGFSANGRSSSGAHYEFRCADGCCLQHEYRILYSQPHALLLARGGYAPQRFGQLSAPGTPVSAVLISAVGLAVAAVITKLDPANAFIYFVALTLFGILFVGEVGFVTHLFFRRKWVAQGRTLRVRMIGYPYTSILGLALVTAIILTTWWVDRMRLTIFSGLVWLGLITVAYWIWERRQHSSTKVVSPWPGGAPSRLTSAKTSLSLAVSARTAVRVSASPHQDFGKSLRHNRFLIRGAASKR